MTINLADRLALVKKVEASFAQLTDVWQLNASAIIATKVIRLSAFERYLTLYELVNLIDEASDDVIRGYREAFLKFFSSLFMKIESYYLSAFYLSRTFYRLETYDKNQAFFAKKLIGPLTDRYLRSPRKLNAISRQLVENSAGLLFFKGYDGLLRGHDDFGCFILSNDLGFERIIRETATKCSLHIILTNP